MTVTGYRARLISAMVTFLVVDAVTMVGRIYVRTKMITRALWLDDFALILTYVSPPFTLFIARWLTRYGFT